MTPHSLWTFILKLIGVYFLIAIFSMLPQSVETVILAGDSFGTKWYDGVLFALGLGVVVIVVYVIVIRLFLFKTGFFIDKLKLDKNFTEEKIDINIHQSTVLQIAVIMTGGLLFIDNLPAFCKEIFMLYQQKIGFGQNLSAYWLIVFLAKTIIGYLMLTNSKRLVNWLELRRRKQ